MSLSAHHLTSLKGIIPICGAILLSACASTFPDRNKLDIKDTEAYVTEFPDVSIEQIASNATRDTFKIGDTADVSVYNVDTLTNTYVVGKTGSVSFPLIGDVQVAGLNTTQLQSVLVEKYGSIYLNSPSINVKIQSQDLGRVVVDGALQAPGVFTIDEIIRLSEAIALAGGLDPQVTNGSSVYIVRNVNQRRLVKEVNLKEIRQLGMEDPEIIPGDVVYVQDSAGRVLFSEFLRTVPLLNTATILATSRR